MVEQKSGSDVKLPFSGTLDDVDSKIENGTEYTENEIDKIIETVKEQQIELGKYYYQQGKVKELKFKYKEANEAFKQAVNCQPDNIEYLNAAGLSGNKISDYEQAEQFLRKSLQLTIDKFGEAHPETSTCYNNLASNLYAQGRIDEAENLYSKGLDYPSV